jgi:hypothetical protein
MIDDLTIDNVSLGRLRPRRPNYTIATRFNLAKRLDVQPESVFPVSLTLSNKSVTDALYAVSDLRILRFDVQSHLLYLSLCATEPTLPFPKSVNVYYLHCLPNFVKVNPGGTTTLEVLVPEIIRVIQVPKNPGLLGPLPVQEIKITSVRHVHCRVAYDNSPLVSRLSEAPHDFRNRLASLKAVEITVPTAAVDLE